MKSNNSFRKIINGKEVKIAFSETESVGVKERVRDILTNSFEEQFLNTTEKSENQ